ncbi:MAG TPA: RraA family protein [Dongiaceae bacterium]|jgi:regulator of RNase E activity RraA|nr:RraA family protein [Dongiaceae bacterium]
MLRIIDRIERIPSALIEKYRAITPAAMGHHVESGIMSAGIKPIQQNVTVVGTAITVQCLGRDSAIVHKVIDLIKPGDVIVIDRGGDMKYACWGEMMALSAQLRGAASVIVDGLVTDVQFIRQCPMPVFCRGVTPLTTQLSGKQGAINVPIQCGGVVVNPGDLICADDNGVAALSPIEAAKSFDLFKEEEDGDANFRNQLLAGKLPSELSRIDELIARAAGNH